MFWTSICWPVHGAVACPVTYSATIHLYGPSLPILTTISSSPDTVSSLHRHVQTPKLSSPVQNRLEIGSALKGQGRAQSRQRVCERI